MKTFGSCHLVINRNPMMIVGTFVTLQMLVFLWEGTSTPFLKWTPSTNAKIFLAITLISGKCSPC